MVAHQLTPERDFRGPGCTDACEVVRAIVPGRFGRSELLLHDPSTHEEYGRITAGPVGATIIWTGALVIDRTARIVHSYGKEIRLSFREWQILDYLAENAGRLCSAAEIRGAVWRTEWIGQNTHRTSIARLRIKLGASARLLQTLTARGFRLVLEPPIEASTEDEPPVAVRPWSLKHAWCVCCGTTRFQHARHGRCSRCNGRHMERSPHYGPCGAPPSVLAGTP